MLNNKGASAEKIILEIGMDKFLTPSSEHTKISQTMREALDFMEKDPTNYRTHVEKVQNFLRVLWTKYDCEDIIKIFDALTIVEPPLLDLERRSFQGYRDHYVHIFNVFILGLRIISLIIENLGDIQAGTLFKVKDEHISSKIPEFHDYSWKERLFYLWTLIADFHDVSVPITHLGGVHEGLNEFLKKFGLEVSGPTLLPYFPFDLETYCELLGSIFEGKMEAVEDWCYKKDCCNPYMQMVLQREFASQNHGVLSGFLMYKKIQEIFLTGGTKHALPQSSFNNYVEYVLKQDIARAALAISLHDLKPDHKTGYPTIFPLDFFDYPLTCLLIIVDGLQEYLRWEGTSIHGGTKVLAFPDLNIGVKDGEIELNIAFFVADEPDAQSYLISQAQAMANRESRVPRGSTLGEAAQDLCDSVSGDIASRVHRNKSFQITLSFSNSERQLFSRSIHM